MSTLCPCCERPLGERVERGGLAVSSDPWAAYWRGEWVGGLPPARLRMLQILLAKDMVAHPELQALTGKRYGGNSVKVHISLLRRWLRQHSIGHAIQNIRGEGYRLI